MPLRWGQIEPLLMQVEKPGRYVGGEFNQVVREHAAVRCCLAFPDLYEIGMSYHGFRILYERINAREAWAAERAYAPWPDFEALLREHGLPLYSLETRRALSEFDWIGFTLQHEVNYTNVLNMIDLGGIPIDRAARAGGDWPLLIGGGEGAFSPEPLADFLDAFVLGDGEEVALELMEHVGRARAEAWPRAELMRALARTPGVYVPEFYEVVHHEDGTVREVIAHEVAPGERAPLPIHKRHFDIAADKGTVRPLVPLMRTVHDRLAVEIRRGCVTGCRFCQAGMINRPVHERSPGQIVEIAREGLANSGYTELALLSLSSGDYTMIGPLVRALAGEYEGRGVSVSLPSLRINGFDVALVDELTRVRKGGFTFAPEAGSERLRRVINKPVDQQALFEIVEDVYRRGWRTLKFYFMIGLPTETDEDLDGIVEICERAAALGRRHHGRKAVVNVTLSPLVPKANTPFQWEGQPPREELERRYRYVREQLRRRVGHGVDVKTADTANAVVEAVLARGDRRVGAALRRAWELGARFDGWDEHFDFERWQRAFAETGIDPAFYAMRERGEDEVLPFEHLEADVGRRFLRREWRRAMDEKQVPRCDTGKCAGCEVCGDAVDHILAAERAGAQEFAEQAESRPAEGRRGAARAPREPVMRLRLQFARGGPLRYLSHLDFAKVLMMILQRAGVPLAWSQGFHPQPRVQLAPPLSLGMGGTHEMIDMLLTQRIDPVGLMRELGRVELEGLVWLGCEEVGLRSDSLETRIAASRYRVELRAEAGKDATAALAAGVRAFEDALEWPVEVLKKKGPRTIDLKQSLWAIEPVGVGPASAPVESDWPASVAAAAWELTITHEPGLFVKPHEAVARLAGRDWSLGRELNVARVGFVMHEAAGACGEPIRTPGS